MPPLRIVMLGTKFYAQSDMGGGLERSARRLFAALLRAGHQVSVLTRNYDRLPARDVIDGVTVYRLPVVGPGRLGASVSYLVQALWWLVRQRRTYDVIHCHQAYAPALIGTLAKRLVGKPVIVKVATADEFSERRELEHLPGFRIRRRLLRRVDRFVMVNERACREFLTLGIAPERLLHIPNGVTLPAQAASDPGIRETARRRLELPWRQIALFVGRLSTEKQLPLLMRAWAHVRAACPDAHLVVVGDGGTFRNVEDDLRRQVQELTLAPWVHFVGRSDRVEDYLLAADVFVLPSKTEGLSNALLEAMAAGLPVVATRIPGNQAVIHEGLDGVLVDRDNPKELAAAIVRLLQEPALAERLGRAARATVGARYAIDRVAEAYQQLYQTVLSETPRWAAMVGQMDRNGWTPDARRV